MLSTPSRAPSATTLAPAEWFTSKSGKVIVQDTPTVITVVTRVARPAPPQRPPLAASTLSTTQRAKNASTQRPKVSAPSSSRSTSSMSSLTSVSSESDREQDAPITKKRKSADALRRASGSGSSSDAKRRRVVSAPIASRLKKRVSNADDDEYHGSGPRPRVVEMLAPEELVYRKSRSRSVTAFEHGYTSCERKTGSDEDGAVGDQLMSSEKVVKRLVNKYKAYFKNPNDPTDDSFNPHPTDYPYVELEYPNDGASEIFILLEPKDKDHYNPIMDLEASLLSIVEFYLSPEQRKLFGTLPHESLITPSNSPPNSTANSSPLTPLSSDSSPLTSLSSNSESRPSRPPTPGNLLRSLKRTIHLRDGPSFLAIMEEINKLLREIKTANGANPLRAVPRTWNTSGIPQKLVLRVIEETYQRCVGPHIDQLRKYPAFSSEVYGELMPQFISNILKETNLRPDSLFMDLGSGVGNVVLHAALQTGCRAFGVELKDEREPLALSQLEQMRLRCRMWGIDMGEVELMKGNMIDCPRVDELLSKADVVLVNNYIFTEELNAALRPKFLDMKEGAILVSLKPFAPPSNSRLTERNIDDIAAIFDVRARPYHSGTVSWSSGSGHYYLHRVDREGYKDVFAQFERIQERLGRRKATATRR